MPLELPLEVQEALCLYLLAVALQVLEAVWPSLLVRRAPTAKLVEESQSRLAMAAVLPADKVVMWHLPAVLEERSLAELSP